MISGAHVVLYSRDAEADRRFFREVLKLNFADAGHGWLIFALPPSEVAVHPDEQNGRHELYLMCDDINETIAQLKKANIACTEPVDQRWGIVTQIELPGGGKLGLYEPRHARP